MSCLPTYKGKRYSSIKGLKEDIINKKGLQLYKQRYGKLVCLIGNVNCALLQTGTDEEVKESAKYAITNGKPGGGYIFSTSNVIFKGMKLERYFLIHDIWKQHRNYN